MQNDFAKCWDFRGIFTWLFCKILGFNQENVGILSGIQLVCKLAGRFAKRPISHIGRNIHTLYGYTCLPLYWMYVTSIKLL